MGNGPGAKKKGIRSKKKQYKRKVWLCHREKDIDQIQDEFEKIIERNQRDKPNERQQVDSSSTGNHDDDKINPSIIMSQNMPINDELPGMGQYYCPETDRYFISEQALVEHKRTKYYKRRCKRIHTETKYTPHIADWGAGKTKETLPPVTKNVSS